ncbi:DUF2252 family protein [Kineosporia sp. R_H_3]|uniref:DUF2252 family protein n=1 Tax=Kineosporia sp. R_H_3 TaxID=1961848 RepID=UPI000B4AD413|nr:DUF2252 family protein [Kineosporia sp. R_H_3]
MSRPRTALDVEGRAAVGKAARQAVPLAAHAGWAPPSTRIDPYYVRLRDWKGSADTDRMLVPGLRLYARLCGGTLARAHARSGDRVGIGV